MKVEMKTDGNGRKNLNITIESEEELSEMGFDHWPTEGELVQYLKGMMSNV